MDKTIVIYKHIVSIFLEIILYSTILLRKEKMYLHTNIINFILIIIFIYTIYLHSIKSEGFQTSNTVHIADNKNNVTASYDVDKNLYHKSIVFLKNHGYYDKSIIGLSKEKNKDKVILYLDPYINYYILGNKDNNILDYRDGIFICLSFKKLNSNDPDPLWNLENKIIAYNYISDYLFIQALIKAYRLDIRKIKLIKINDSDLQKVDKIFDLLFTYVVINSEYMNILESSSYYINSMIDIDINRILPFYPFIRENHKSMREYFSKDLIKEHVYDNVALIPLMNYKIITFDENFITRLKLPEDYIGKTDNKNSVDNNESRDVIGYGCYGNQTIKNKFECNSEYNIDGSRKTYYSIWDKKCDSNEECPFYTAHKNRGGCDKGQCELPVGIKRLAFMKYDDKGVNAPFCYECNDMLDFECCNKIKNPDYVYPNDRDYRLKYNLQSIIDRLDYINY